MKPNSVLTPPTPEEKLLYKGDFPYRKVVGALLWLQNVRPDISQTVRQLARHCLRYSRPHAEAAIHVLKYVYATRHMKIVYSANRGQFLPIDSALRTTDLNQYLSSDYGGKVYKTVDNKYVDLDHYRVLRHAQPLSEGLARVDDDDKLIEIDTRLGQYTDASFQSTFDYKSVSGYCIFYAGAVVDWGSQTQTIVASSTMESELNATHRAVTQLVPIRTLLEELHEIAIELPTVSFEDNKACKLVLNSSRRRKGARHIGRALERAHQWMSAGVVQYISCGTKEMVADIFTKPLAYDLFKTFRDRMLNVVSD